MLIKVTVVQCNNIKIINIHNKHNEISNKAFKINITK